MITKWFPFNLFSWKRKQRVSRLFTTKKSSHLLNTAACLISSMFPWRRSDVHMSANWWLPSSTQINSLQPRLTWIGHATFLIQIGGCNILTDPIFDSATPLFPRILAPGIALHKLPKIDVVILSHNHPDHMDSWSLKKLAELHKPRFFVPKGDKRWFDAWGIDRVKECIWWQELSILVNEQELTFSFLPACHWSQRSLFDRNHSLWGSWMVQWAGKNIYFGGDTSYDTHFLEIAKKYSSITAALLPIGPCKPNTHMKHSHMSMCSTVQALIDLKAQHFFPMHWGTFAFGTDRFLTPIKHLLESWRKKADSIQARLHVMHIGEARNLDS